MRQHQRWDWLSIQRWCLTHFGDETESLADGSGSLSLPKLLISAWDGAWAWAEGHDRHTANCVKVHASTVWSRCWWCHQTIYPSCHRAQTLSLSTISLDPIPLAMAPKCCLQIQLNTRLRSNTSLNTLHLCLLCCYMMSFMILWAVSAIRGVRLKSGTKASPYSNLAQACFGWRRCRKREIVSYEPRSDVGCRGGEA